MAKATIDELELHHLIELGNKTAFSKLFVQYQELIVNKLKVLHPLIFRSDHHLIATVVTDSFFKYFYRPTMFNPEKQTLEKFLLMNAEGDLINEWAKREKMRRIFRPSGSSVELEEKIESVQGDSVNNTDTPLQQIIEKEEKDRLSATFKKYFDSDRDIEVAYLILSNERDTQAYAEILEITHLKFNEQQKEVKRTKDRIKKVLDRNIKGKQLK